MVLWSHPETHRWLSVSDISTPLKNGSVEPSGSSQVAVHEWYLIIPKEWFCGAIWNLIGGCP